MPKLIYQDPESGLENVLELGPHLPEITIGRNPGNDLRVNNPSISRTHARIIFDVNLGKCTITDLKSSNGTYVNGNRIQTQMLVNRDRVRVGEFPLDFVEAEEDMPIYGEPIQPAEQERNQTNLGGFGAMGVPRMDPVPMSPPSPPSAPVGFGGEPNAIFGDQTNLPPSFGVPPAAPMGMGEASIPMDLDPMDIEPLDLDLIDIEPLELSPESILPVDIEPMEIEPFGVQPLSGASSADLLHLDPVSDYDLGINPSGGISDDAALDEVFSNSTFDARSEPLSASSSLPSYDFDQGAPSILDDEGPLSGADVSGFGLKPSQGFSATPDATFEESSVGMLSFGAAPEPSFGAAPEPSFVAAPEPSFGAPKPSFGAAPEQNGELDIIKRELEDAQRERGELQELLNQAAQDGSAGGASRLQLDRLRKECDRLRDERRNLMRQISEQKRALEAAPEADYVEGLEQKLEAERQEKSALQGSLDEVNQDLSSKNSSIEQLESEVETRQSELNVLNSQYQETDALRTSADQTVTSMTLRLEQTQALQEETQQALEDLQINHETLSKELDQARSSKEALEQSLSEGESNIGGLHTTIETQRKEIEEQAQSIKQLEETLDVLENDIGAMTLTANGLREELDARPMSEDVRVLQDEMLDTKQKLQVVTATRDELEQDVEQLGATLQSTKMELTDTKHRFSDIDASFSSLQSERDTLKQEKAAFARETEYLQDDKRKLVSQVDALSKRVDAFEKDRKAKKMIFGELSTDLKRLVAESESLKTQNEELRVMLDTAPSSDEVGDLQARVLVLQDELAEVNKSVTEYEHDATLLTRELGALTEERDAFKAQAEHVDHAKEDIGEAVPSGEVDVLKSTIETLEQERDELMLMLEELSGDSESVSMDEFKALEGALEEMMMERDELEAQLKAKD